MPTIERAEDPKTRVWPLSTLEFGIAEQVQRSRAPWCESEDKILREHIGKPLGQAVAALNARGAPKSEHVVKNRYIKVGLAPSLLKYFTDQHCLAAGGE
jgi:hypothetical protein